MVHFEIRSFVCRDDNQLSVEMTKFKYSHISIRASLMYEIVENYENSFKKQWVVLVQIIFFVFVTSISDP